MLFPIAIELGDAKNAYGVIVPDLPGCFSAGDTMEEAIANAEEAILLHLEDDFVPGNARVPSVSTLADLQSRKDYRGFAWGVVDVDLGKLSAKSLRVNITVPERLLNTIDEYAERHGESRSAFLTRAALEAMAKDAA
ncbi:MAG TPA: type II toxin-antitoxin system HicB family antitoxin [Casimicrobiaceae bacterium]|nr:type II toxin-antitoxin system HicB family antitoxin [Casimicrobiaceae bacterium]